MENKYDKRYALFGFLIVFGIILFMLLLGLIFTTFFQVSLTKVIGIISPIAFGLLGLISLLLIFNFNITHFISKTKIPTSKNPTLNAILYGFFFGAIVIPCNPAFIAAFFARALLFESFFSSMFNFILFGLGLGFPLLAFSLLSVNWSKKIIGFLSKHSRKINLVAGILMLWISIYYLTSVFGIFSLGPVSDFIGLITKGFLSVLTSLFGGITISGTGFFTSFLLGLLTPLTAVCVLPLYPAFLTYLANQFDDKKK